jgi:hypothetical protein
MKYAAEMSSGCRIYLQTGSGIQKLMGYTDSMDIA